MVALSFSKDQISKIKKSIRDEIKNNFFYINYFK
jgi:hypothetical protein